MYKRNEATITIKITWLLFFLVWVSLSTTAQTTTPWKGKSCAVVLTYDDGLDVHLTNVIPALDSLGFKATFYVANYNGALQQNIQRWRAAAAKGHELGNHTVYHPCEGGRPGREFVTPDYDMNNYTLRRMTDEIRTMNILLTAIDGKTARTFAFPCGDRKIHDTPYIDPLQKEFVAARGVTPSMPAIDKVDLYNVPCYGVMGQTGAEMIKWVKEAEASQGLLVILFHGVGGGHGLNVSLPAHRELLLYLKQQQKSIWVAPMTDVAAFIKQQQGK